MCRQVAIRSRQPARFAEDLVSNQHALVCQSRCDQLEREHADGWGIAAFARQKIEWARGVEAAFSSADFEQAANQVCSNAIFAHVRKASKGQPNLANTHPFLCDGWMFMHNGTLTAFETLQAQLVSSMLPPHRDQIAGQTDSECIFYWLLSRLHRKQLIVGRNCLSVKRLRQELGQAVMDLNQLNDSVAPKHRGAAKLNLMLSNGRMVVGSRFGNTLYYQTRREPQGGEIQSWLIASEPTSHDEWLEIPDYSTFSLDANWRWNVEPLNLRAS